MNTKSCSCGYYVFEDYCDFERCRYFRSATLSLVSGSDFDTDFGVDFGYKKVYDVAWKFVVGEGLDVVAIFEEYSTVFWQLVYL